MTRSKASKSPLKGKLLDKQTKLEAVQQSLSAATGELSALRGQVGELRAHTPHSQSAQDQPNRASAGDDDQQDVSVDGSVSAGRLLDETMAVEVASLNNLFTRIQASRAQLISAQQKEGAARETLQAHEAELGEARGRLDVLRAHVVKYRQMIVETEMEDAQTGTGHKTNAAGDLISPDKNNAPAAAASSTSSTSHNHAAITELRGKQATMQVSLEAMEQCARTKSVLQTDMVGKEAQLEELRRTVSDTSDALSASAASVSGANSADGPEAVKAQLSRASALRRKLLQASNELDQTEEEFVQINALLETAELELSAKLRESGYDSWMSTAAAAESKAAAGTAPNTSQKRDVLARAFIAFVTAEAQSLGKQAAALAAEANPDGWTGPDAAAAEAASPIPHIQQGAQLASSASPVNLQELLSGTARVVRHPREKASEYGQRLTRRLSALLALENNCLAEIEDKGVDVSLAQEELYEFIRVREEVELELKLLERLLGTEEGASPQANGNADPDMTETAKTTQESVEGDKTSQPSAGANNTNTSLSLPDGVAVRASVDAKGDESSDEGEVPLWAGGVGSDIEAGGRGEGAAHTPAPAPAPAAAAAAAAAAAKVPLSIRTTGSAGFSDASSAGLPSSPNLRSGGANVVVAAISPLSSADSAAIGYTGSPSARGGAREGASPAGSPQSPRLPAATSAAIVELSKAQTAREYWSIKPSAFSATKQAAHAALLAKKTALAAEADAKSRRRGSSVAPVAEGVGSQDARARRSRTLSPQAKAPVPGAAAGAGARTGPVSKIVVRPKIAKPASPKRKDVENSRDRDAKAEAFPKSLQLRSGSSAGGSAGGSISPTPSLTGSSIAQVASRLEELAHELAAQKALAAKAVQAATPSVSSLDRGGGSGSKRAKERMHALHADQRAKHALHISLSSPTGSAAPTPTRNNGGGPAQLTASRDLMATLQRQQAELEQLRSAVSAKGKATNANETEPSSRIGVSASASDRKAQVQAAFAELKESSRTLVLEDEKRANVTSGSVVPFEKETEEEGEGEVHMPEWAPAADSDSSDGEPSAALLARKAAAMNQRRQRQEAHALKQAPQTAGAGAPGLVPATAAAADDDVVTVARQSRRANTLAKGAINLHDLHDAIGVKRVTAEEMAELKRHDALVEAKLQKEAHAKALLKLEERAIAMINAAALEATETQGSPHSSLNSDNQYGLNDVPDWAQEAKNRQRKGQEDTRERKLKEKESEVVDAIPVEVPVGLITEEHIQTTHSKYLQQLARAESKFVPGGARVSLSTSITPLPNPKGARRSAATNSHMNTDANVVFLLRELATAREAAALLAKKQELLEQHESINAYTGFAQTDGGYSLGLLQLTIINARELPNKKLVLKVDPYVEVDLVLPESASYALSEAFIACGSNKEAASQAWKTLQEGILDGQGGYPSSQRTTTQYNTLFPEWREPLVFAPVAALEQYVRLRVKDSTRSYTDDTIMAECILPLDLLKDQCTHRFALTLARPEDVASTATANSNATAPHHYPGGSNSNGKLPDTCVLRVEGKLVYSKAALNTQRKSEAEAKIAALEKLLAKVQANAPASGGPATASATPAPTDSSGRAGRSRYKYGYAYAGFSTAEPPLPAMAGGKAMPGAPLECSSAERGRNRLRILGAREKVAVQYGLVDRHEHSSRERLMGAFGPPSPLPTAHRSSSRSKSAEKVPRRGLSMTPASSRSFNIRGMSPSPLQSEIQSTMRASSAPAHARMNMSPAQRRARAAPVERRGFGSVSPTGRHPHPVSRSPSSSSRSFTSASAGNRSGLGQGGVITRPAGTGPGGARAERGSNAGVSKPAVPIPPPYQRSTASSMASKPRPVIRVNGVGENGMRISKLDLARTPGRAPRSAVEREGLGSNTPGLQADTPTSHFLRKANANWSIVKKLAGTDSAAELDEIDAEAQADIIIARAKERALKESASRAKTPPAVPQQGAEDVSSHKSFHEALRVEMLAAEAAAKLHAAAQQYRRTFRGAYVVHKPRSVDTKTTKLAAPIFGATSRRF